MAGKRKIVIVGATGGIGRAVKTEAERRGWLVVGTSRTVGAADYWLDCADKDGLEQALARLFTAEGPFDAMAFCAGVCPVKPLSLVDAAALAETFFVDAAAFVLTMKHFARPGAFAKAGACAVAVSSVSATEGWSGGTLYCAAKGALSAAARALAAELAPKNIRVRTLEPRYVLTDMFRCCAGRMGIPETEALLPEQLAIQILDVVEEVKPEA